MVNKSVMFKAVSDYNCIRKAGAVAHRAYMAVRDSASMERARLLRMTFSRSLNGTHVCVLCTQLFLGLIVRLK